VGNQFKTKQTPSEKCLNPRNLWLGISSCAYVVSPQMPLSGRNQKGMRPWPDPTHNNPPIARIRKCSDNPCQTSKKRERTRIRSLERVSEESEMSERRDSAIKLFGKTIPLSSSEQLSHAAATTVTRTHEAACAAATVDDDQGRHQRPGPFDHNLLSSIPSSPKNTETDGVGDVQQDSKQPPEGKLTETTQEDGTSNSPAKEMKDPVIPSDNPKEASIDKGSNFPGVSKNDQPSEASTSISQERTLKKPDKILPCPRCNSMETKFCYFNNYNVNQPRHFCKNCQRYWTAGGTMRNVPVGSGRRKNKGSSASQYRHIMVSDALRANGNVLAFRSHEPLSESRAFSLNLAEKPLTSVQNGFHRSDMEIFISCGGRENGDDHSGISSLTASESLDKGGNSVMQESAMRTFQTLPLMPPPTFGPSSLPITIIPAQPYWVCTLPGSWNMPWLPPSQSPDPSMCSSANSPSLGKRSRDGEKIEQ
ncbi:hypothetical protein NMG60_11036254, partial [Bertholletia excelsa]